MRTLLSNTEENRQLLEHYGIKLNVRAKTSSYILVKGIRGLGVEEENEGADYRTASRDEIITRLEEIWRMNENLLDILEDALEVKVNLRPLNIGREKLSVDVLLAGKKITSETKIITTNGLGQRST